MDEPVAPGLDPAALSVWLAETCGVAGPLAIQRIGNGQSNLTFLVTGAGDRRVVVRRPPLGSLARGAHDMAREYRIMSALQGRPVPTPAPIAITAEITPDKALLYAMEHVEGSVLHTTAAALGLSPDARRRATVEAVSSLTALHNVDVDAVGLSDLARHSGYAERQLAGWSRQWAATRTRELPVIERVAEKLAARIPEQRGLSLVHGDFGLANMIVGPDGSVRAVLDWELSTLGDPLADLGTLLTYWPQTQAEAIRDRDPVTMLDGFPSRDELVELYARDRPAPAPSELGFWVATGTWKLAIIFEGITRRRLDNPANSLSTVEELRSATEHLAARAEALADA